MNELGGKWRQVLVRNPLYHWNTDSIAKCEKRGIDRKGLRNADIVRAHEPSAFSRREQADVVLAV